MANLIGGFMKRHPLCVVFFSFMFICSALESKIEQIEKIESISNEITQDSFVLFNIAEVLMDTQTSLGTQAWRKYVRTHVDSKTHDELTHFVFSKVPPKVPEVRTIELIDELQSRHILVLAFTSRGRHEWYGSQVSNVDALTEMHLKQIGINFSKTLLPEELKGIVTEMSDYYHDGIIYSTNSIDKGQLLEDLLMTHNYHPKKIIFVDDKADSLKSVEKMSNKLGVDFVGFAYGHTAKSHNDFDLMIANIQLDWLLTFDEVISDEQAAKIKIEKFGCINADDYFKEIIQRWINR